MPNLLLYYAHPGQAKSQVNAAMWRAAQRVADITVVDLYAEYPRFNINIDKEQDRLRAADVIFFQYPFFWYSSPAIVKEWLDLVLEHGFAYGSGGTALAGKSLMLALSTAGPAEAYTTEGYQHFPLRTFLTPMEQSARLCKMTFLAPYVLHGALKAPNDGSLEPHVTGYPRLLEALRDGRYDLELAQSMDIVTADTLPVTSEV